MSEFSPLFDGEEIVVIIFLALLIIFSLTIPLLVTAFLILLLLFVLFGGIVMIIDTRRARIRDRRKNLRRELDNLMADNENRKCRR